MQIDWFNTDHKFSRQDRIFPINHRIHNIFPHLKSIYLTHNCQVQRITNMFTRENSVHELMVVKNIIDNGFRIKDLTPIQIHKIKKGRNPQALLYEDNGIQVSKSTI